MDQALKQRLVGASVLIILAIIVLPMLLSGQPDVQNETRSIEVPPKPAELSFETRRFPIGDQQVKQPSELKPAQAGPTAGRDTAQPPGEQLAENQPAEERVQEVAGSVADMGSGAEESVPESPGRYLVQVASFSSAANANHLVSLLRNNGMPVLMDNVVTSAGKLHRVRAGPYDQVTEADRSVDQIRALMSDLNPRVLDLRPDESAPVTDPSDPLVRWVVQAGSFSDHANALSLVTRLRAEGFTAYPETITGPEGTTVYKVKVGPVIERQSAIDLSVALRQKMNINGTVMSVD